jgi:hypothetical protein
MKTSGKVLDLHLLHSPDGMLQLGAIDPTGGEKEKLYTDNIEMIRTGDGIDYTFDTPAKADSTEIVGMVNGRQVSTSISYFVNLSGP